MSQISSAPDSGGYSSIMQSYRVAKSALEDFGEMGGCMDGGGRQASPEYSYLCLFLHEY